jgi:hypothetical protein
MITASMYLAFALESCKRNEGKITKCIEAAILAISSHYFSVTIQSFLRDYSVILAVLCY